MGLGQIGGSVAAALHEAAACKAILGFDIKPDLLATAHARGYLDNVVSDAQDLITKCDIIIVALPMGEIFSYLKENSSLLMGKLLVIDTGSLKAEVTALAESLGMTNFVGGHPLAGTEKRGSDSWDGRLFAGENFFVTPTIHTDPQSYQLACDLVKALGAYKIEIDGEQHDKIFATTSNIPHLFAFLLQHKFESLRAADEKVARFVCPSFYGATRVAQSDPEMVFQMLWHNRSRLEQTLGELITRLQACHRDLADANETAFRKYFLPE